LRPPIAVTPKQSTLLLRRRLRPRFLFAGRLGRRRCPCRSCRRLPHRSRRLWSRRRRRGRPCGRRWGHRFRRGLKGREESPDPLAFRQLPPPVLVEPRLVAVPARHRSPRGGTPLRRIAHSGAPLSRQQTCPLLPQEIIGRNLRRLFGEVWGRVRDGLPPPPPGLPAGRKWLDHMERPTSALHL